MDEVQKLSESDYSVGTFVRYNLKIDKYFYYEIIRLK
jgi:hypothetical protein